MINVLVNTHHAGWISFTCVSAYSVWETLRIVDPIEFWVIGDNGED